MTGNKRSWEKWNDPEIVKVLDNDWQTEKFDSTYAALQQVIKDYRPAGCLDVGCGTGRFYPIVRDAGVPIYEGVDGSDEMLKQARKRYPGGRFEKGDIYNLGWNDDAWDLVVCSDVLVHIPRHMMALRELYRVTRKVLFLRICFATPEPTTVTVSPKTGHLNCWYNVEETVRSLNEVGFREISIAEVSQDEMGGGIIQKAAPEFTLPKRDRRQLFVGVK